MITPRGRRGTETLAEPDPVDVYVGRAIRLRRKTCRMSQTELGQACGISFQQVQKYERATNRVSISMLARVSQALDHPIVLFFPPELVADRSQAGATTVDLDPASAQMVALYRALEWRQREALSGLLKAMVAVGRQPPTGAPRRVDEERTYIGRATRKPRLPHRAH